MDWLTEHAELAEGFLIPQASGQAATSVELAGALRDALSSPLDYPAFEQTVFAGDTVAIVLQQGLPKPRAVIAALLEMLASSDVALTDVTFVVSPTTAGSLGIKPSQYQPVGESDEDHAPIVIPLDFGLHQVNIQVHDANNHADQAYLAANTAGLPVYVNRTLVEADFVLPVGAPLPGDTALNDGVYPHFSGSEARERFDQRQDSESARQAEVELANDMLGSFFTVQLVCGPGEITHSLETEH